MKFNEALELNEALEFTRKLNDHVQTLMDNIETENDIYNKIIFAYVSIVIEHHRSIIELTNVRQTSALTLIRPLFEAYIRATWLSILVGTENVDKTIIRLIERQDNDSFPSLRLMCEEIDSELSRLQNRANTNILSNYFKRNKDLWNSYTHGGSYMVSILVNSKDIFTHEDMISISYSTTSDMLNSVYAYAVKTRNINLANEIDLKMTKVTHKFYNV